MPTLQPNTDVCGQVPSRQQKVVRWLEEHSASPKPTAGTSKRQSKPISRESSMSSTTSTSESDYYTRTLTAAEEDYGWATSSESDGPTTPPHSTYGSTPSARNVKWPGNDRTPTRHWQNPPARPVCREWAQGLTCRFGEACKYAHALEVSDLTSALIKLADSDYRDRFAWTGSKDTVRRGTLATAGTFGMW
jgi:hypothetical protein